MGFYNVYSQNKNIQLIVLHLRRESIHDLFVLEYDSNKVEDRKEVQN